MADSPEAPQPPPPKRPSLGHAVLLLWIALMAWGALGTCAGLIKAVGAVGGKSVDPSREALNLAVGMSQALNCAAFGALVALIGGLVFLAVRLWSRFARRFSKS